MHPDQMYQLRQLQHQDLRAELEQARARRELTGSRPTRSRGSFVIWLRRLIVRRLRGVTVSQ